MESNPVVGLVGFWMMMQLVAAVALLIGGIYLMYCLGRAASGLDRMAHAMEDWVAMEQARSQPHGSGQPHPSSLPLLIPQTPPPSHPSTAAQPQPEYSRPDESPRS